MYDSISLHWRNKTPKLLFIYYRWQHHAVLVVASFQFTIEEPSYTTANKQINEEATTIQAAI